MTARKRATGFALMDTAFMADSKFMRLSRLSGDPARFASAVGVFWIMLAECRRAKTAVVDWQDFEEYSEQIDLLRQARLLQENGFPQEAFDRWAPAYVSPWDKVRKGTQGYEEERTTTPTSSHVMSSEFSSSSSLTEGGVGETNEDAFEVAAQLLGLVPNSDDWRRQVDDLEQKFGTDQTILALQRAYAAALQEKKRLSPFDLLKAARSRLLTSQHREEKELSNEERVRIAEDRRKRDDEMLADIKRQEKELFDKYHPDWNPGA